MHQPLCVFSSVGVGVCFSLCVCIGVRVFVSLCAYLVVCV